MSLIVALKHEGSVLVGADSCASIGDVDPFIAPIAGSKISRIGEVLLGYTGNPRVQEIADKYAAQGPLSEEGVRYLAPAEDEAEYMERVLVPWLRERMEENGIDLKPPQDDDIDHCGILAAVRSRVFLVHLRTGACELALDAIATGSGSHYAMGYVHALIAANANDAEDALLQSLAATAKIFPEVLPPFQIERT